MKFTRQKGTARCLCSTPAPNLNPNSIRNPLPLLSNNATLEKIDGVIGYSYNCIDNGEVVVIFR